MQFNLVVLSGSLVVSPEVLPPAGKPGRRRALLTVESPSPRRRVDLIPVVAAADVLPPGLRPGDRLYVVGALQRRFSAGSGRSRLEVVAQYAERPPEAM